jgi:hypothetical protein
MILTDCVEERTIDSKHYSTVVPSVQKVVQRGLQQAMIPGNHLVSVHIKRSIYEAKIEPLLS